MNFEQPSVEKKEEKKERIEETINGIELKLYWDDEYGDYCLYLPQIEIGDEAYDKGVSDQVLRISENFEEAKRVFETAKLAAQGGKDVYQIYLEAEKSRG